MWHVGDMKHEAESLLLAIHIFVILKEACSSKLDFSLSYLIFGYLLKQADRAVVARLRSFPR